MLTKSFIAHSILRSALCARVQQVQEVSVDEVAGLESNDTAGDWYLTSDGDESLAGCPERAPCPRDHWYCPKNKGCYGGFPNDKSQEKLCGVPFCPPRANLKPSGGGGGAAADPPHTAPAWNPPSGGDAFQPIDTGRPLPSVYPSNGGHYMPPRRISAPGRHQTNKFWTNWISGKAGDNSKPIFTMPYALNWNKDPAQAELQISHGRKRINMASGAREGRIAWYMTTFSGSFAMGTKEGTDPRHYEVTKEGLLGIHAEVKGSGGGTVTFPLYRGMAYITGNYHGMTPRISSPQGYIKSIKKVSEGVFDFKNDEGDPNKMWGCHYYKGGESDAWCKTNPKTAKAEMKFFGNPGSPCGHCDCCERPLPKPEDAGKDFGNVYRVWVMEYDGNPRRGVEFTNTSRGFVMNKPLKGWVRMAHIVKDRDAAILDKHAPAVLENVELYASKSGGKFGYNFDTKGHGELLHWAWIHQTKLMRGGKSYNDNEISHIEAPTKGKMVPMRGSKWDLEVNLGPAHGLPLMPKKPSGSKLAAVSRELDNELNKATRCSEQFGGIHPNGWNTRECEWPRVWLFAMGFYNNGKGLQRLGVTCLMGKEIHGSHDDRVVKCSNLLKSAFECHYNPSKKCSGVPPSWYDEKWGGVVSRQGFNTHMCGLADFGNACYNDHHYHYGYFIHAGAMLLELKPEMKGDNNFIAYINSMVRDISNPSTADPYFPQFRAFDWYDLHSWSHGVTPSNDGKDEESTSEDMNAYFGIQMWAKLNNARSLQYVAEMQLSLLAHSAKNIFLIKDNNEVHPKDYIKNRATGIFFESKAHYGTFFGASSIFIHGIQMIPLTPALPLARDKEFCRQEWNDIVSKIPLPMGGSHAGWGALLITGNVAFHDPERAWGMINAQNRYDNGMSKAWAMYWVASMAR